MKHLALLAAIGVCCLTACNTEPTRAAKEQGALNSATPGKYERGAFADDVVMPTGFEETTASATHEPTARDQSSTATH